MDSTAKSNSLTLLIIIFIFNVSASSSNLTPSFPKQALPTKSGYLSVNATSNSAIFYAFYEAQSLTSPLSQTPLLIWLQGGPGCSSMIGNFFELGPWRVTKSLNLIPNPGSWNRIFGLLFLDNPIGTGFSIASNTDEIPRDQNSVAQHLYTAITTFIQLDPAFKDRQIYINGESYAGKYVPAIGYHILRMNSRLNASQRVNLAGVAIGDGLTHPLVQVTTHAAHAYFLGLINERQKNDLEKIQFEAVRLIKQGNWSAAREARSSIFRLLHNMTGLATSFDFTKKAPYKTHLVTEFLKSREVKKALGVSGSFVFKICSGTVKEALREDVMKSVKYMVEYLVTKTRVLLYQGQHDLSDGPVQVEAWVKTMKWEGIEKYLNADRKIWKVNGELAGYVQKWQSLANVVVLGAGHYLPHDQAGNSQAMIEDWVLQKGLFENVNFTPCSVL
ncbi:hypothetical protein QN277_029296 [Acacia crassicarpa]|uniref:Carboxypeptidase n=1 Tax=Acacia crassicarpa TaxID=499986 RepID=A0AAE1J516_9FABA|nr:hypothetical protein QN277_029296 [Acacia crassicarpa]